MTRQFIACRFAFTGRTYTYHNDGEPVAKGERVRVQGRYGEQSVEVVELLDEQPPFDTKPIIGRE